MDPDPTTDRLIRLGAIALAGAAWVCASAIAGPVEDRMHRYETPYYIIYSDLEGEAVLEAIVRTSAMAEDYLRLFGGFTGRINKKWQLHLYGREADYHAAGGPVGSGGVLTQRDGDMRLMTFVQGQSVAWSTVQHEGAHQFVYKVISDEVPLWVNEGLAEYFSDSIFTGDSMVHGVASARQVAKVKRTIRANKAMGFAQIMAIEPEQWVEYVQEAPYNQVWAMVYFLLHAEDGKYAGAFNAYLLDIGRRGQQPDRAWAKHFGADLAGFERQWAAYWLAFPDEGSAGLYVEAAFRTMTSFLARYLLQDHTFDTSAEFFDTVERQPLTLDADTWLPRDTLRQALRITPRMGQWSLAAGTRGLWTLTCRLPDGTQWTGSFRLVNRRVTDMTVTHGEPKPIDAKAPKRRQVARPTATRPTTPRKPRKADPVRSAIRLAEIYIESGQTDKARGTLADALEADPRSPWAAKARRMLDELK